MRELEKRMGAPLNSLQQKLKRNSLKSDEERIIAKELGYEILWKKKESE